jgi:hypothetical protein
MIERPGLVIMEFTESEVPDVMRYVISKFWS